MTKTIWKFPLQVIDLQSVTIPTGAKLLDVQVQGATPCLWALVDPDRPKRVVSIRTHGTGHVFTGIEDFEHVGTYQLHGGGLVFHVFAEGSQ